MDDTVRSVGGWQYYRSGKNLFVQLPSGYGLCPDFPGLFVFV